MGLKRIRAKIFSPLADDKYFGTKFGTRLQQFQTGRDRDPNTLSGAKIPYVYQETEVRVGIQKNKIKRGRPLQSHQISKNDKKARKHLWFFEPPHPSPTQGRTHQFGRRKGKEIKYPIRQIKATN